MRQRWTGLVTSACLVVTAAPSLALAAPAAPAARERPAAASGQAAGSSGEVTDHCRGQCHDVLPPGENGSATAAQIILNKITGAKPKHSDDQLGKYADLVDNYAGLTNGKLSTFFNDASFGVPEGQAESRKNPGGRADVTITRDRSGIPHIKGTTRFGTEYGAGYAAGQDRLWMMDVFRHIGRGELTSFAGGAEGNRQLEQQFYLGGAYKESELRAQVDRVRDSGPRGQQAYEDVTAYLKGLNRYIDDAKKGLYFPGEYDLTGNADILTGEGIEPFKATDLVAIGTVISALFGSGGGDQVAAALVKQAAERKYGKEEGEKVYRAFRMQNDPEADLTLHDGQRFDYAASPGNPRGVALPDPGSVSEQQVVYDPTGSAARGKAAKRAAGTGEKGSGTGAAAESARDRSATSGANLRHRPELAKAKGALSGGVLPKDLFARKHGMSNALVVSGKHTDTGNPVAVFGPQTGYFAPQLLMLQEIQGPGLSARGAAFAGLNMYVQLGRGQDYAWSATSANQNMTDTYAVDLCNTDGSPATKDSTAYVFHGRCTPMEKLVRENAWRPTLADGTRAGSYKLVAHRTKYGVVRYRATIDGKPVAYTALRSTYHHEVDTLIGFQMFNDPDAVTGPESFQKAASRIGYTFNWFYADARHTAYYNSGLNPTRRPDVDPNLPIRANEGTEWQGWDPETNTVPNTPFAAHPHDIGQDYYESWNNKIAKGYTVAGFGNGPVYRSNLLDERIKSLISDGKKVSRASLTRAMEDAAVTDLRGEAVLPLLLKVIGTEKVTDPGQKEAVDSLRSWLDDGAKRKQTGPGSRTYAHADAIRLMDAWWPLLVEDEFRPNLGTDLYDALTRALQIDETPSTPGDGVGHKGSAFQQGWWSYVHKDLRNVLGEKVPGAAPRKFCGAGDVAQCRRTLLSTLAEAARTPAAKTYPGDDVCEAGDQWCADAVQQRPLGGITHALTSWQNRPTYQQVVQFPSHR
ncbi:penicillin acylase family protein [Streptomyces albus subsp. chlorinus]|uniref:penicillin acylase family protein n=1 Tax=Streptomyces albus TaxID=1888 RepID=UPI00156E812E|nr:penicillin acylase family protein [Streptomyces albus]NSC20104.1 penicillin acylase family protein [Streptomyces albus subsp. chlorinus]